PDPCLACTGTGTQAIVTGLGCGVCSDNTFNTYVACNPAIGSPAHWHYSTSSGIPPTCVCTIDVFFLGGMWTVIVSNTNGATMPAGSSSWQGTFPVGALSCSGGLSGTVSVPFASSTGVGCGAGSVSVTFS